MREGQEAVCSSWGVQRPGLASQLHLPHTIAVYQNMPNKRCPALNCPQAAQRDALPSTALKPHNAMPRFNICAVASSVWRGDCCGPPRRGAVVRAGGCNAWRHKQSGWTPALTVPPTPTPNP